MFSLVNVVYEIEFNRSSKNLYFNCKLCIYLYRSGDAIRCWRCSSRADPNCADSFSNSSIPPIQCTQAHTYDLTPIESCLKIKHKEAEGWVYERGCDRKDKPQFKQAEFFWCSTDFCNAADDNHRPKLLLTFLLTSFLTIKLLRF